MYVYIEYLFLVESKQLPLQVQHNLREKSHFYESKQQFTCTCTLKAILIGIINRKLQCMLQLRAVNDKEYEYNYM